MYRRKSDDLERYIFLQGLLDRDETLFYRLLYENLEEMVPIVYTPTVGQACLQLSHITRRFRGVYLTPDTIAHIDRIFQSLSFPQIVLIVATDGERILGLGDLGSDGMGIPVDKVNLYISLRDVVRNAKPTVLIGLTAQAGLFDRAILERMAANDPRPVIMPLSNPNSKSECTPADVCAATKGMGLVATGSPFPPVTRDGKPCRMSQCNNMYIFPGVGLGALVAKSSKVTPGMFLAASRAVSGLVTDAQRENGALLPDMKEIREVSFHVACAVAREAHDVGLGRLLSDEEYAEVIRKAQWEPRYYPYRPGPIGG